MPKVWTPLTVRVAVTVQASHRGFHKDFSWLSVLSGRRGIPPACDESTSPSTRWRLQYDVYEYFLPENDLSERSLFRGIQAVADVQGMIMNGKRVGTKNLIIF